VSTAGGPFLDPPPDAVPPAAGPAATIEVFHIAGCPSAGETVALARSVAARVLPEAQVRPILLDEAAFLARGLPGSPTVLVGGRDIAGREATPAGLIA